MVLENLKDLRFMAYYIDSGITTNGYIWCI